MQEMSEVVIVTIPDTVSEDLPSVVEEDKAVLVTAELTPQSGYGILHCTCRLLVVSDNTLIIMFRGELKLKHHMVFNVVFQGGCPHSNTSGSRS